MLLTTRTDVDRAKYDRKNHLKANRREEPLLAGGDGDRRTHSCPSCPKTFKALPGSVIVCPHCGRGRVRVH